MTTVALIVAAGSGSRTGLDFPKQYLLLDGKTVLEKSITAFKNHAAVDAVVVVINQDDRPRYEAAAGHLDILPVVSGGESRQQSVYNGLCALKEYDPQYVLIHDAARPFVDSDLIDRCMNALEAGPAVLPGMPMTDTLKYIEGAAVLETLDRSRVIAAQTPQCFDYNAILSAHETYKDQPVTDDIALAEQAGLSVTWVLGAAKNIKITTEDDIRSLTMNNFTDVRTGHGYDVHAFDAQSDLWLAGVKIPHDKGLKGHSDADVALHALTDALLGAIGAGDIGVHFPPTEAKWKGASSDIFLSHAAQLIADKGGKISNVDLTIICEAPKINPHRLLMQSRIAEILNISEDRVSIKGTTTEKLGFTGRKEGIAAQAIATVRLPE